MYVFIKSVLEFTKNSLVDSASSSFTEPGGVFFNDSPEGFFIDKGVPTWHVYEYLDANLMPSPLLSIETLCKVRHRASSTDSTVTQVSYLDVCEKNICSNCYDTLRIYHTDFALWMDAFDMAFDLYTCAFGGKSSALPFKVDFTYFSSTVHSLVQQLDDYLYRAQVHPVVAADFPFNAFELKRMLLSAFQRLHETANEGFALELKQYALTRIMQDVYAQIVKQNDSSSPLPFSLYHEFFTSFANALLKTPEYMLESEDILSLAKKAAVFYTDINADDATKKLQHELITKNKLSLEAARDTIVKEFISSASVWGKVIAKAKHDFHMRKAVFATKQLNSYFKPSDLTLLALFPSESFVSADGAYLCFTVPYYVASVFQSVAEYFFLGEKFPSDTAAILETAVSLLSSTSKGNTLAMARVALKDPKE